MELLKYSSVVSDVFCVFRVHQHPPEEAVRVQTVEQPAYQRSAAAPTGLQEEGLSHM